ncbi:hypothetical protein GGU10DRAFT_379371 [Lentinula aff. detonsa]|uniref:TPX2 C-terminal domain-containing protein n=1 Tax=Lentinula aff. detonsa TaxID=2804958 RepID=A0AA38NJW8_9AGAR|nr:hypothetical protein GGU10DRAFT_379371 [Lentinula aff. detonsa]
MQNTSANDLSLRHLPDLSNSSFSFEIPPESNDEFLLDHDDDFFGAASDSFATPAPSRTIRQPLTKTRSTPEAFTQGNSESRSRTSPEKKTVLSDSSHSNSVQPPHISAEASKTIRTKSTVIRKLRTGVGLRDDAMSTPHRIQRLRDEIKGLAESKSSSATTVPSSTRSTYIPKNDHRLILDPKAADSGEDPVPPHSIPASTEPPPVSLEVNQTVRNQVFSFECEHNDMSVISSIGLAGRLVMYDQNSVRSHELSNSAENDSVASAFMGSSSHQGQLSIRATADSSKTSETASDMPLTFSQLSPSKTKEQTSIPHTRSHSDVPPSPMRQSHKRQGTPFPDARPGERDKTPAVISSSRAASSGRRLVVKKRTPSSVNSSSVTSQMRSKPVTRSTMSSRNQLFVPQDWSGSSGASSMGQGKLSGASTGSLTSSSGSSKVTLDRSGGSTQPSRNRATRSDGFKFHSDMRIEARKTDSIVRNHEEKPRKKQKLHTAYTVPNFEASRSAQDVLLTSLKDHIRPVFPLPVEMHTDARARERSKFDELVREKELQASRALKEKKRQQAEEEKREIKEQRKKAIPKAHPVPEWYKDAPRRKEQRPYSRSG